MLVSFFSFLMKPYEKIFKEIYFLATENLLQYFMNRDWTTAELSELDAGKTIKIIGWLNEYNNTNRQFQKLKDGYGVIQLVTSRDEVWIL